MDSGNLAESHIIRLLAAIWGIIHQVLKLIQIQTSQRRNLCRLEVHIYATVILYPSQPARPLDFLN